MVGTAPRTHSPPTTPLGVTGKGADGPFGSKQPSHPVWVLLLVLVAKPSGGGEVTGLSSKAAACRWAFAHPSSAAGAGHPLDPHAWARAVDMGRGWGQYDVGGQEPRDGHHRDLKGQLFLQPHTDLGPRPERTTQPKSQ